MIKRIFTILLCAVLVLPIYNVNAENSVSITAAFTKQQIEVDEYAQLQISVTGDITQVKANIAYSNYFLSYSGVGLGFDINSGEYTITFTPGEQPFTLNCLAFNPGEATVKLTNIRAQTPSGTVNLDDVKVDITVTPKYIPVYTKQDLNNIRQNLSENYILMNDIEFTAEDFSADGEFYNDGFGWLPIGAVVRTPFTGRFNGNGHTIRGLTINKAYYNYCGLFGVNRGEIADLRMEDAVIDGRYGINMSVSTATPEVSGNIDYEDKDVWTEPDDSVTEESLDKYDRTGKSTANLGVICGFNLGSVKKSYAAGVIYGNNSAGGIAGRNNAVISECVARVNVDTLTVAGGIAGVTGAYSKISDCVSECTVAAVLTGGILGSAAGTVERVYSVSDVGEGKACFGKVENLTVNEVYAFGEFLDDGVSIIRPMEELPSLRFSGGNWTYGKAHYPTHFAYMVESASPGDLNDDGEINTSDLAMMKLFLAGNGEIAQGTGDLDGDGQVNTSDLAVLKLNLAGAE